MKAALLALLASLRSGFRSRTALQLEVLALRHQLAVYQRCPTRPRTKVADRLLWAWLSRTWAGWRNALVFVQPSTVIAWQRRRFRDHWARLSHARPGRTRLAKAVQDLIREISNANPRWGSPRIVEELAKLGIHAAKATVERYMVRPKKPPSPTWRAFLANHVKDLVSVDFFVVPTVAFRVLFVFIVLAHARRRIVHFNVTEHPTAQWTAHQLSEAFPWEAAPRYLIRDRDRVYGPPFRTRVERMGIVEVLTAPRSPWQNPFVERVIGSVRRECLDQVIVLDERHLRRLLGDYFHHYHAGVATARSPWTARSLDLCKGPSAGMLWRSRKPAASIATTSGTQPERVRQRRRAQPHARGRHLVAGVRPHGRSRWAPTLRLRLQPRLGVRPEAVRRAEGVLGTDIAWWNPATELRVQRRVASGLAAPGK